jgi:hypothetical protein
VRLLAIAFGEKISKRGWFSVQRNHHKRLLLVALCIAAVPLTAAATAFACVQTIGQLSVTGPGTSGTSTAIGNGHHPGPKNVEYCVPPTPGAVAPVPTGFGPNARANLTVSLAPSSQCNPFDAGAIQPGHANTPADGVYEVNFCDGKIFRDSGNGLVSTTDTSAHGNCFFSDGVGDAGVLMGALTVTGGSGSAVLKLPGGATKNGPNAYAGVAVREKANTTGHPGPPYVNMAPIQLVVL